MQTATITIGSIMQEVEVGYTVDRGQKGSREVEPIAPCIEDIKYVKKKTETGGWVDLELNTLINLGLYREIYDILTEELNEGKL